MLRTKSRTATYELDVIFNLSIISASHHRALLISVPSKFRTPIPWCWKSQPGLQSQFHVNLGYDETLPQSKKIKIKNSIPKSQCTLLFLILKEDFLHLPSNNFNF